jgi:hypothetical protein
MKVILIFIFSLFLLSFALTAQEQKTITIKAGTRIIDYFPFIEQYRYPEFLDGKVLFKNSTFTAVKLNYNILLGEMQFIQKKDTLSIANVKDIDYVEIARDTFYYDNGYLEVLTGHDPVIMTVKQYVKFLDVKREAAYGTSSIAAIDSYSSMFGASGTTVHKLILKEDIVLSRNTDYYIGSKKNSFFPYRKKNLLKFFPQYKTIIESYLKKNRVDFKAKDDLFRLTAFLQGIGEVP